MEGSQKIVFTRDRRGAWLWILNILWLVLGGWHMFLTWFTTGVLICCTCIGIPFGIQVIKISIFLLFPFGKVIGYDIDDMEDDGMKCFLMGCNCAFNCLWAVTAGWILALQAFLTGCLFIFSIIGIPFGWQCFKLMYICFRPFGIKISAHETVSLDYQLT